MKQAQKGNVAVIAIIIVIVAITAGVIGWLFARKTQIQSTPNKQTRAEQPLLKDETANWQTYKNAEIGFEIKYPKDWSFGKNGEIFKPNSPKNCGTSLDPQGYEPMCRDNIGFVLYKNEEKLPIEKLFETEGWKEGQNYKAFKEYKNGDISGYTMISISDYDGSEVESFWSTLENGDYLAIQGYYLVGDEKNVFQKMISTFKPIKIDYYNWQTYRNERLGFEMKIPKKTNTGILTPIENGNIVWFTIDNGNIDKEALEKFNGGGDDFSKSKNLVWAMLIKSIKNDAELDSFIKNKYGKGCKLGKKELNPDSGLYDVQIEPVSPGGGFYDSSCFLNWILALKYSPEKGLVASVDMGQDRSFASEGGYITYDPEMINSFRFIK